MPVVSVGAQQKRSLFQRLSEYVRANYFIPDARKGWVPYAVKQAEVIINEHTIDAVITTGPPHSTHLIGLQLKEKYGLKWIADFRDPWTGIFYNNILPRTDSSKQKDKALETQVLQTADLVTVISPGMKKEFESRARAIEVVMNGYDEQDFEKPIEQAGSSVFTIRYVGNLMTSQNASGLWSALNRLKQEGYHYKLEFIGRVDEAIKESIALNGLTDNSTYVDFVKHQQAINLMQQADMLLFAIPDVKDNALILTGKLFEYLASKSNILSYGPVNGNAAEILQSTGRNKMIDFADTNESYNQLKSALDYYAHNKHGYKFNNGAEKVYSRKNQAGLLSGLLNKL